MHPRQHPLAKPLSVDAAPDRQALTREQRPPSPARPPSVAVYHHLVLPRLREPVAWFEREHVAEVAAKHFAGIIDVGEGDIGEGLHEGAGGGGVAYEVGGGGTRKGYVGFEVWFAGVGEGNETVPVHLVMLDRGRGGDGGEGC